MLGLVRFYSDNFVANVNQTLQNTFRFANKRHDYLLNKRHSNTLFRDYYTIQDIEKRFRECLIICINVMNEEEKKKYNENGFSIIINPDLKLSIKSLLDLIMSFHITDLLEFEKEDLIVKANEKKLDLTYRR